MKEIFEKIISLKIDEAVYYNYESNKQEKEVQIRCDNGYARIYIRPDETKISVYDKKNRHNFILDKTVSIKQIEKYLEKPVWYNGVFRKVRMGV